MTSDFRLEKILQEYETEWDDSLIPILQESFPQQIRQYICNYQDRIASLTEILPDTKVERGSKDDPIFQEYLTVGFYIIWISLLRTLDIRVSYMLFQRTSIIFTQYLIVYAQARQNHTNVEFNLKELVAYILTNILGGIEVPVQSTITDTQRMDLWGALIKLYSKCKVEYV